MVQHNINPDIDRAIRKFKSLHAKVMPDGRKIEPSTSEVVRMMLDRYPKDNVEHMARYFNELMDGLELLIGPDVIPPIEAMKMAVIKNRDNPERLHQVKQSIDALLEKWMEEEDHGTK